MSPPLTLLEDLLSSLFSADELRRFLRRHNQGASVVDLLPGDTAPKAQVMYKAAEVLLSKGLAHTLLAAMAQEYKGRAADIQRVASNLSSASVVTPQELPTVVILTALELEYEAVRDRLGDVQKHPHEAGTVYELGSFPTTAPRWRVAIAEIGARNAGAAAQVERALTVFKPRYVLFLGVAGGVKDVDLGDVVCASKVYAYHSGKDSPDGFLVRPVSFPAAAKLAGFASSVRKDWNRQPQRPFKVYEGPIAAGEAVIAGAQTPLANFLRQHYSDTLAVDMEGAGFMEGAHLNHAEALVIRGISDLLDGKSQADRSGSQERAAQNAATVAFKLLEALDPR